MTTINHNSRIYNTAYDTSRDEMPINIRTWLDLRIEWRNMVYGTTCVLKYKEETNELNWLVAPG